MILTLKGQKKYFEDLLTDENSKFIWSAINQLTNNTHLSKLQMTKNSSVGQPNDHFSIETEKNTNKFLIGQTSRVLPIQINIQKELNITLMTVVDICGTLIHLKHSNTRDFNGLDTKIQNFTAPVITDTLTYVYNLCIDFFSAYTF